MNNLIYLLALIGILLSLYTIYLFRKVSKDQNATAVCDINNRFSCTEVAKSPDAKIFGIPNGVFGIGFYILIALLWFLQFFFYAKILAILGLIMTFYFIYKLYKLHKICIVCCGIYIVNLGIFIITIL